MAQTLGRSLQERGAVITAVASRTPAHAAAAARFIGGSAEPAAYTDLPRLARRILIAVSDDSIATVAAQLAAGMRSGIALHTSGLRGPEVLDALAACGVACGTLHPLQTVANPEEGLRVLPGCAFAVDGVPAATAWACDLAAALGGSVIHVPASRRPLYHAAAVMASNFVTALMSAAVMLMEEAGVADAAARQALLPLARTSVENALRLGPAAALTGPFARGDAATVAGHLTALAESAPELASLYRATGRVTLALARRRGLPETQAARIEALLQEASSSRKGEHCD